MSVSADLLIAIPVYNDWPALNRLLSGLDSCLCEVGAVAEVLLVDDCSTICRAQELRTEGYKAISSLKLLSLARNLGHQRAIAIALAHLAAEELQAGSGQRGVVVMDGDGEDRPEDVLRFLELSRAFEEPRLLFARRRARTEGLLFRLCYRAYRCLFQFLTGHSMRMGNFSLIPAALLPKVAALSELWNNYPGAVLKSKLPIEMVDCDRGFRLAGRGQMSYSALVVHGLAAMSVFGEVLGVRALMAAALLGVVDLLAIAAVVTIRLVTDWAVPGWATYAFGLTTVFLSQLLLVSLAFVFLILQNRSLCGFVPARDYRYFVLSVRELLGGDGPLGCDA